VIIDELLTIVVPVRNGEDFLRETLNNLVNNTKAKIVVSDNFSTDSTSEILREYGDLSLMKPDSDLNMVENWNFVTEKCQTPYFRLVSHDDIVYQDSVSNHLETLLKNQTAAFAFSSRDFIFNTKKFALTLKTPKTKHEYRLNNASELLKFICKKGTNPIGEPLCVTFNKEKLDFAPAWFNIEHIYELETYIRALRLGPGIAVQGKSGKFRIHTRSYSSSVSNYFKLARSLREWVLNQPEATTLILSDKLLLEFTTRLIAIQKQIIFGVLKLIDFEFKRKSIALFK
jgi:glycosyltransferase involved in cell wall biosynthesis